MSQKAELKKIKLRWLGGTIFLSAVGSFGFRIVNLLLSFGVSILLTRILGVDGYGIYAFAMSWVFILNIIGSLGCQGLVVREVATNKSHERWGLIRGFLKWSNTLIFLTSVTIALIFAAIGWFFPIMSDTETIQTLLIALFLVPVMSLTILRQSAMQGLGHIVKGQIPESILQPLLFIAILASLHFLDFEVIKVTWVMGVKVISSILAFLAGTLLLYRIIPNQVKHAEPEYQTEKWFPSMLSLIFIAGTGVIFSRSDVVMLGIMAGPGAVGLYAIAFRLANFVLLSQQVGANVLGPHVATLHANGETKRLQELTRKSTRAVTSYALSFAFLLIILSNLSLSIFGPEFVQARSILIILCLSNLLNAATGPVGLLLNMTNYERTNAAVIGFGAILNLILNFILIPPFGAEGAAIATSITSIAANILLAGFVYKRLGINCTILNW